LDAPSVQIALCSTGCAATLRDETCLQATGLHVAPSLRAPALAALAARAAAELMSIDDVSFAAVGTEATTPAQSVDGLGVANREAAP
jgi:hypothetical protein